MLPRKTEQNRHVANLRVTPVIAVRLPIQDEDGRRLHDGIYNTEGRPTCVGGKRME